MIIKNKEHPFQPGVEVAVMRYIRGNRYLNYVAIVYKAHANGIVVLKYRNGGVDSSNYRPMINGFGENKRWELRQIGNRYGPYFCEVLTPELKAELEAEEAEREMKNRVKEVEAYIHWKLKKVALKPEQLARMVAILNEDKPEEEVV